MKRKLLLRFSAALFLCAELCSRIIAAPLTEGVKAMVTTDKVTRELVLAERSGSDILYAPVNVPAGLLASIRIDDIKKVYFEREYDRFDVFKAANEYRWTSAASLILQAFSPALPFVDLPNNNAAAPLMEAGSYMMKGAAQTRQAGGDDNNKMADKMYQEAFRVFSNIAKAKWFESAPAARLKATQCQIETGKLADADKQMASATIPDADDPSIGLYWATMANLRYAQTNIPEALEAAVKSVIFESKDMDTFPDMLLLSARCYEKLQNMHRARDVYYEVARLFKNTEYAKTALARLVHITDNKLILQKEKRDVVKLFFDREENMEAIVTNFLESVKEQKPKNR